MPASAQRYPRLYPDDNVAPTVLVVSLQRALFVNRCYGNRVRRAREDDGIVGPLTKKAIDVFVDEYRQRNPTAKPFASIEELRDKAVEIEVTSGQNEVKYCERSRFRSQYFDGTEHAAWTPKYANLYPRGSVEIARMKTELFKNGCYGDIPEDAELREDFGSFSRRALHVFVDEYAQRYGVRTRVVTSRAKGTKGRTTTRSVRTSSPFGSSSELQRALEQEAAKDSLVFCMTSRFMQVYFSDVARTADSNTPAAANPNVCQMPRAANDWLKAQEDDFRSKKDKGPTPLPPLSPVLDAMEGAQRTFLEAIPDQPPANSVALGMNSEYSRIQQNLYLSMQAVNRGKARLAKLGAISQNDVCRKCYLVSNYEWLTRFAEFGRIPVFNKEGRPEIGGSPPRPLVIDLNELYFDALLKSHVRIQDWRTKEERFLTLLRNSTNKSSAEFDQQRDARRAADIAKSEAMLDLYNNNQRVPPSLRQPLDRASEFTRQRAVSCIGSFSLEEGQ